MQLAKSMLRSSRMRFIRISFSILLVSFSFAALAQDNSPYSRYGLGDVMPSANTTTRGMGGISAGYADILSINFSNPASYSQFQTFLEQRSKKVSSGRVILDAGLNFSNRTLIAPNTPNRFTSSDILFSYLQVGLPIRKNWGLSFGLRPVHRISYLINRYERLKDPVTGLPIDSSITQLRGSGGSYLPSIGTGFGFKLAEKKTNTREATNTISFGLNAGYMFGSRENTRLRSLINDSVLYYSSDHTTNSSFGDIFFNSGIQYQIEMNNLVNKNKTFVRLGASGNWQQNLKGSQDSLVQTFTRGSAGEELQIDSVYQHDNVKGEIIYPASYKFGFVVQRINANLSGWLFGADYSINNWDNYRFFGNHDSVGTNWQINVGGQFNPRPRSSYFSRVVYRFGFNAGPDYIKLKKELPQFGVSFGMGLPIGGYNRLSRYEYSMLNLGFEYGKRGNNDNLLKENLFRISIGLNFTDLWFVKKKYD